MKFLNYINIFFSLTLLVFLHNSCKKHNPEDPWYYIHSRHINERLEGEWELVKLCIDDQDSSAYLDIDTMNVATFFKFEPTYEKSDCEGMGFVYIKTKNMASYPEKIGVSQSLIRDMNDPNVAITKLYYHCREAKKCGSNFFKFGFAEDEFEPVGNIPPNIPSFKPFDSYFLFNNYYIRPLSNDFIILKSTRNEFVISTGPNITSDSNPDVKKEYRYEFKKIK